MPSMSWSQFYEECKTLFRERDRRARYEKPRGSWDSEFWWPKGTENEIRVEWEIGGVSGGSCWEDSNPQGWHSSDPEPDFEDLDRLLMAVCPTLPFHVYKQVLAKVVRRTERTVNEYYGNRTIYGVKFVAFRDLYDALCEIGVFDDDTR